MIQELNGVRRSGVTRNLKDKNHKTNQKSLTCFIHLTFVLFTITPSRKGGGGGWHNTSHVNTLLVPLIRVIRDVNVFFAFVF